MTGAQHSAALGAMTRLAAQLISYFVPICLLAPQCLFHNVCLNVLACYVSHSELAEQEGVFKLNMHSALVMPTLMGKVHRIKTQFDKRAAIAYRISAF